MEEYIQEDPLEFMRAVAKEVGVKLKFGRVNRSSRDDAEWGNMPFSAYSSREKPNGERRDLSFYIEVRRYPLIPRTERNQFYDYIEGKAVDGMKSFRDFHPARSNVKDFGNFLRRLRITIGLEEATADGCDKMVKVFPEIDYNPRRGFCLRGVSYTGSLHPENDFPNELKESREIVGAEQLESIANPLDYRPVVRRVVEAYAFLPREKWHDPSIYCWGDEHGRKVVNAAIDILFAGEEGTKIRGEIERARLKLRRGWASIPKLSLGAVRLPDPGQKDVNTDRFVVEATPYIVEYLGALGIMNPAEAEAAAERSLTRYLVHQGGFQLSRGRAKEILESIRGSDRMAEVAV